MQSFVCRAVALGITLGFALPAAAAPKPFRAEAVLETAAAAPTEQTIDGVQWRCEAQKCVGTAENRSSLDSLMKECRKVAAVVGPLTSYTSRGRELNKSSIKACNSAAGKTQ